ncbi:hypothetical protein B0H14DRAFT_3496618 [Mycena olivaceomarginata]|nr:hypothetical protein B0H14DRAFT_3496618 [Mycena olivaceomarginata]
MPNTFMLEGMKGWLASAMKQVVGGHWQRIVRVEWRPHTHYYIEFNTDNTVLHVKGLVDAKDGTIQLAPSVTLHAEFSTWTHTLLSETGLRVLGICKKLLLTLPFSPVHISLFKRKDEKSLSLSSKVELILRTYAYLEIQGAKF